MLLTACVYVQILFVNSRIYICKNNENMVEHCYITFNLELQKITVDKSLVHD